MLYFNISSSKDNTGIKVLFESIVKKYFGRYKYIFEEKKKKNI